MMEQLKESDVDEEEMAEVDREMFNRLNATEDGQLIGRVEEVKLQHSSKRGEYIQVVTKTPVGNKGASFPIPDTPTDDDDIVRLCKANGVDPKYPSMLEGCEVKWDGDDLVIPKSPRKEFVEKYEDIFTGMDSYHRLKLGFFFIFLPITLTTYYLTIERRNRRHMRQSMEDFVIHILIWFVIAFPIFGTLIRSVIL